MNWLTRVNFFFVCHQSDHANVLETRLSFGATRYEAAKPFAIETIRVSMLPILMQLSVMG